MQDLKDKVEYLEEVRRQFEEFKVIVKEKEEAQKELDELN